jgi:hypothetical protein
MSTKHYTIFSLQNASEWPHYVMEDFRKVTSKEELDKVSFFIFLFFVNVWGIRFVICV